MMARERFDMEGSEENCMLVRKGDLSRCQPLLDRFMDEPKGPFAFLRKEKERKIIEAGLPPFLASRLTEGR